MEPERHAVVAKGQVIPSYFPHQPDDDVPRRRAGQRSHELSPDEELDDAMATGLRDHSGDTDDTGEPEQGTLVARSAARQLASAPGADCAIRANRIGDFRGITIGGRLHLPTAIS